MDDTVTPIHRTERPWPHALHAAGPGVHRLGEVVEALGGAPDEAALTRPVPMAHLQRGDVLFHEGSAPECLYVVGSGWFKSTRTGIDGYEHVLGFHGRGDVLGFEALAAEHMPCSAAALEIGSVFVLPLCELDTLRRRSGALDHALQRALAAQLMRAAEIADMMAAVASEVRLARFLIWMSRRMADRGESPRRFVLRMTRREIASQLGVAHETISRGFGLLAERGQLRVDAREVEILDLPGLCDSAVCTRRDPPPPARVVWTSARPGAAPPAARVGCTA